MTDTVLTAKVPLAALLVVFGGACSKSACPTGSDDPQVSETPVSPTAGQYAWDEESRSGACPILNDTGDSGSVGGFGGAREFTVTISEDGTTMTISFVHSASVTCTLAGNAFTCQVPNNTWGESDTQLTLVTILNGGWMSDTSFNATEVETRTCTGTGCSDYDDADCCEAITGVATLIQ